jgi:hypothetical protein
MLIGFLQNKKKYHAVGKSNGKIVRREATSKPITQIDMATNFTGLVQALQYNAAISN